MIESDICWIIEYEERIGVTRYICTITKEIIVEYTNEAMSIAKSEHDFMNKIYNEFLIPHLEKHDKEMNETPIHQKDR